MRITVTIDDEFWADAQEITGITNKAELVREALKAFVARESARQLAKMGGTMPNIKDIVRRRPDDDYDDDDDEDSS